MLLSKTLFLSPQGDVIEAPKRAKLTPTGRLATRRSLNDLIDQYCGPDAETAVAFLAAVARGDATAPARRPGPTEDSHSVSLIPQVGPTISERLEAALALIAHRHGKPGQRVELSGLGVSAGPSADLSRLSDQELELWDQLARKALPAEQDTIDVTPNQAPK